MASKDQVNQLRRMASYAEADPYDDTQLSAMIDASSMNRAAARLWTEKAASLATLVNVSESGSSRSLGDAHKNALAMAAHFTKIATEEEKDVPVDTDRFARTRAIVREG